MRRVVVVGNGMAGARLVDELCRRDSSLAITVVGSEDRPAYNRILLSDVLAGKRRSDEIDLSAAPGRVVQRLGTTVTGLDRVRRTVSTDDGAFGWFSKSFQIDGVWCCPPGELAGRLLGSAPVLRLDQLSQITGQLSVRLPAKA